MLCNDLRSRDVTTGRHNGVARYRVSPRPLARSPCFFSDFFSRRRRHTSFKWDWSSDVCSSDLIVALELLRATAEKAGRDDLGIVPAGFFGGGLEQFQSDDVDFAVDVGGDVLESRVIGDAHVGRDGPRGSGPDGPVDFAAGELRVDERRVGGEGEPVPNGCAGVVFRFAL